MNNSSVKTRKRGGSTDDLEKAAVYTREKLLGNTQGIATEQSKKMLSWHLKWHPLMSSWCTQTGFCGILRRKAKGDLKPLKPWGGKMVGYKLSRGFNGLPESNSFIMSISHTRRRNPNNHNQRSDEEEM